MPRLLVDISRSSLLAALIFTVWAYGGVRWWTIDFVPWWLGGTFLVWLAGWTMRGQSPGVPRSLWILIGAVLVYGWAMTVNAAAWYEASTGSFRPLNAWLPGWPGSVDVAVGTEAMWRLSALLLVLPVASDLARNPVWRQRVWLVLAINAVVWALYAMIQKALGAPTIFWEAYRVPRYFFGTYAYHANAASFLLIGLGLVLGRLVLAVRRPEKRQLEIAAWGFGSCVMVAALFMNTSRAGQMLGIAVLIGALGLLVFDRRMMHRFGVRGPVALLGPVVAVICVGFLLFGVDWSRTRERWESTWTELEAGGVMDEGRVKSAEVAMRAVTAKPWFGYGPGTFKVVFPNFRTEADEIPGFWKYAHHDYLQSLMDWGVLGVLGWSLLVVGGLWNGRPVGLARHRSSSDPMEQLRLEDWCWRRSLWLSAGAVLVHALGDFPLQILSIQMLTLTLLGMGWGTPKLRPTGQTVRKRRRVNSNEAPPP